MSIRVVHDGGDGYTLYSRVGDNVGSVRGGVVSIVGFSDKEEALEAGLRAYHIVAPWAERQRLKPLAPIADALTITSHDRVHGFELALRGPINDGVAIHAALITLRIAKGEASAAEIEWPSRGYTGSVLVAAPVTQLLMGER